MAELVDALVSGTSIRKDVQVRVLFQARFFPETGIRHKYVPYCPDGGIGRHTSLRGWRLLQGVQVRVLFWALFIPLASVIEHFVFFSLFLSVFYPVSSILFGS
jgi:hypothetical protein